MDDLVWKPSSSTSTSSHNTSASMSSNKTPTTIVAGAKDDAGGDKKRRKPISTGAAATDPPAVVAKVAATAAPTVAAATPKPDDVYASTVRSEELESRTRTTAADTDLFHQSCADFRSMLADIVQLKLKSASSASATTTPAAAADKLRSDLSAARADGAHQLVVMKKLNRLDKVRLRGGRDALHREKLSVDSQHLQLQNLLYEAEHLRKEVQRCFQFKSHDSAIELVPEAQFYAEAPTEIARPDQTRNDEHARRLARLEWELAQRKQLSAMCRELHAQKQRAAELIATKTERLESLAPRLEQLLRATRPLQEALAAVPAEAEWKVQRVARLLPGPLYMAWANLAAYAEACDRRLVARINGDESDVLEDIDEEEDDDDEVVGAAEDEDGAVLGGGGKEVVVAATEAGDDEAMESDGEEQQRQRARRHHRDHRRTAAAETAVSENAQSSAAASESQQRRRDAAQLDRLLRAHPLSVSFDVRSRSAKAAAATQPQTTDATLTVTLRYLAALNVVTASCSTAGVPADGAADSLLAPASLLAALGGVAADTGARSPNARTHYQLLAVRADSAEFGALLAGRRLGVAYAWAQQLCGLDMSATASAEGRSDVVATRLEVTQAAVPQVVRRIRQRWQTRLQLAEQMRVLRGTAVRQNGGQNGATGSAAELVQWQPIGWEEYRKAEAAQRFVEASSQNGEGGDAAAAAVVASDDLFYAVTVARGGQPAAAAARFECAVRVSVQHPRVLPLWAVAFHRAAKGAETAQTNAIIREIECWINSTTLADGQDDNEATAAAAGRAATVDNVLATQLQRARTSLDIYVETTEGLVEGGHREKTFLRAFRSRTRSRPLRAIETSAGSVIYTQV